ncbi:MAG: hypothetical protein WA873_05850 [Jannaschia helgolandensis]
MRNDGQIDRVEDYTNAFLGMAYLMLVMILVFVWGVWGYPVALATCVGLHWAIRGWGLRRAARNAAWDARIDAVLAKRR